ncbi:amino acid ABC transporter substrate-binding protein [Slackia equolifaciens]|uniref:Amino acid ABC transporter substrate-binding protein n=1 Tax=Slackia equolifaciens TaxID=498718 RepID=A0A3N0AV64_9ACTN|nr:transporter substrate-binding domain-containing protein [Slackia equolifaciens]RNL38763.1 amino acid ABC transporter substrate-binding protein [Slackia equolifaciens]
MGKKSKLVAAALVFAVAAFSLVCMAGCSADSQEEASSGAGTLRVGVRDDIMNFSYLNDQTGKHYGLEVDIANEMAKRLGYADVEFVSVTPDSRKDMLLNGGVDCLVACYSIADSRLENFDFSPAYYTDRAIVMVENSSLITDVEQLEGKTVGIMSGSNAGPVFATKMYELGVIGPDVVENTDEYTQYQGILVKKIATYEELSKALETGEVDAAAMDNSIASTYMNEDRSILDVNLGDQEYGVATQKDSELSGNVANAIQEMLDDGTIAAYIDKWN